MKQNQKMRKEYVCGIKVKGKKKKCHKSKKGALVWLRRRKLESSCLVVTDLLNFEEEEFRIPLL